MKLLILQSTTILYLILSKAFPIFCDIDTKEYITELVELGIDATMMGFLLEPETAEDGPGPDQRNSSGFRPFQKIQNKIKILANDFSDYITGPEGTGKMKLTKKIKENFVNFIVQDPYSLESKLRAFVMGSKHNENNEDIDQDNIGLAKVRRMEMYAKLVEFVKDLNETINWDPFDQALNAIGLAILNHKNAEAQAKYREQYNRSRGQCKPGIRINWPKLCSSMTTIVANDEEQFDTRRNVEESLKDQVDKVRCGMQELALLVQHWFFYQFLLMRITIVDRDRDRSTITIEYSPDLDSLKYSKYWLQHMAKAFSDHFYQKRRQMSDDVLKGKNQAETSKNADRGMAVADAISEIGKYVAHFDGLAETHTKFLEDYAKVHMIDSNV